MAPVCYICGDVHLAEEANAFGHFLEWLGTRPPARLVVLGDLFEYWIDNRASTRRYAAYIDRFRALVRAGWRIDVVQGNRELGAERGLEVALGARLHWPHLDLRIGGRLLRVVHGDRLCHDPVYHFFAAFVRAFPFRVFRWVSPEAMQEGIARFLRRRSRARARRQQGPRPSRIFIDPRRVAAAGRGGAVVVAGHIHEAWRRRVRGVELILVGDWPGGVGHWLEVTADGGLTPRRRRFFIEED